MKNKKITYIHGPNYDGGYSFVLFLSINVNTNTRLSQRHKYYTRFLVIIFDLKDKFQNYLELYMDGHIFLECNTIPYYLNIPFNNKKFVSVFLEINSCVMVTRLCPRAAWFKLKKERHELSLSLDAIHKLHAICDAGWGGRCRGEGGGGGSL